MNYPMRMVRTRRHELIGNTAGGHGDVGTAENRGLPAPDVVRVLRFGARPNEIVNRADDPALRAVKNELIAKLKMFQTAAKAPVEPHAALRVSGRAARE
jgi:hypothetical protein